MGEDESHRRAVSKVYTLRIDNTDGLIKFYGFVAQQLDDEAENDKTNSRTEKNQSNKKRKKCTNSTAYIKKM